jgi:hypothetical protein
VEHPDRQAIAILHHLDLDQVEVVFLVQAIDLLQVLDLQALVQAVREAVDPVEGPEVVEETN